MKYTPMVRSRATPPLLKIYCNCELNCQATFMILAVSSLSALAAFTPSWSGEKKVKARTCRVRLKPTLLPFKSATHRKYIRETSHKVWTDFRGQDHPFFAKERPFTRPCRRVLPTGIRDRLDGWRLPDHPRQAVGPASRPERNHPQRRRSSVARPYERRRVVRYPRAPYRTLHF